MVGKLAPAVGDGVAGTKTAEVAAGARVAPVAGGGGAARLPLLDVLRGVAILGTLMTNVWIFAAPGAKRAS